MAAISSPEVAKVEASAAEARAAYAAAQELLHHSNVTAPFAGTVYQLPVKPGAYVNGGELLVQVANLEKVQSTRLCGRTGNRTAGKRPKS